MEDNQMKRFVIVLLIGFFFSGCAPIEHTATVEQRIGQPCIAGIGDIVIRVDKKRDLENAFGKASISGRQTNEGFSELRFAGVENNGEVVLYRKDVRIMTNETTMSRTPFSTRVSNSNTNVNGSYYDTGNVGTFNAAATTNSTSTSISRTSDYHVVVPSKTLAIRIPAGNTKVPIEGYVIEIIKATPISLEYKIIKY
jgi:hypothetical protein